ncbi:hypothetical protein [Planobispora longispora]|uniref:Uncharacterized protein n=1 Tax=Planobispora longispora TaxID=28887 RepID=A0A8J3W7J9_9ACTN|nr:hypothetical protein [Planobispora longispora]BFE82367.1 hypothetical protein GCM10020093_049680 [Planobispora longispora]GIH78887.1 hypothetical protein Plo01_53160 [Planobispora longispora]
MEILLRVLAEMAPVAGWAATFLAAVIAAFVLYVGIAMIATLLTRDQKRVQIRYRVFRELLQLFRRSRR